VCQRCYSCSASSSSQSIWFLLLSLFGLPYPPVVPSVSLKKSNTTSSFWPTMSLYPVITPRTPPSPSRYPFPLSFPHPFPISFLGLYSITRYFLSLSIFIASFFCQFVIWFSRKLRFKGIYFLDLRVVCLF